MEDYGKVVELQPPRSDNAPADIAQPEPTWEAQKAAAKEAIDLADGFMLFAFKNGEAEINGQRIPVPKSMFNGPGCIGGGSIVGALAYIISRVNAIKQSIQDQHDEQQARLCE